MQYLHARTRDRTKFISTRYRFTPPSIGTSYTIVQYSAVRAQSARSKFKFSLNQIRSVLVPVPDMHMNIDFERNNYENCIFPFFLFEYVNKPAQILAASVQSSEGIPRGKKHSTGSFNPS